MSKITRHLIFDIGGVLIDHDNVALCAHLKDVIRDSGFEMHHLRELISVSGIGVGHMSFSDFFHFVDEQHGISGTENDFRAAWNHHFTRNETIIRLFTRYCNDYNVALCSNTNDAHWDFLTHFCPELRRAHHIILSHEVHCEKPAPEIYEKVLAEMQVPPGECVFIDDKLENIQAANALGMSGVLYHQNCHLEPQINRVLSPIV